jgi:hypothetical protein
LGGFQQRVLITDRLIAGCEHQVFLLIGGIHRESNLVRPLPSHKGVIGDLE